MDHSRRQDSRALTFIAVMTGIALLKWAQGVFVPLTVAILVSLLLAPLVKMAERGLRRRTAAVVCILTLVVLAVGSTTWMASRQIADLVDHLPRYRDNIQQKVANINAPLGRALDRIYRVADGLSIDDPQSRKSRPAQVEVVKPPPTPFDFLSTAMGTLAESLGSFAVVFILVLFLLVFQSDLRDRIVQLTGARWVNVTTRTLDESASGVGRYLLTQTLVNAGYGIAIAGVLLLLGIPNVLLCGLTAGLLRFIPYIGPWIGVAFPLALSMAIFPGWDRPIMLLASVAVLEILFANALEPWLYGRRAGLSPLAVVLSALFWAWLWGPVGLLLSVPLTTCLATLGRQFRGLGFLNTLLGSDPPLQPEVRLYQRLLSRNAESAFTFADEYLKTGTRLGLFENLILPALALAKQNHAAGELDDEPYERMLATVAEIVDEHASPAESPAGGTRAHVLVMPADGAADEFCGLLTSKLLTNLPADFSIVPDDLLSSEKAERLRREDPDILFISALPPSAVLHVRQLCKRLRPEKVAIVVAVWGNTMDDAAILERIGVDARVVRSMNDAVQVLGEHVAAAILAKHSEPAKLN